MKWQTNYKKFGWQSIKQDLTAVIRWPCLSLFASTIYLMSDSVLWWQAQFLHDMQYQCVLFLHTMHTPLPHGPFDDLSASLTLKTGFPLQHYHIKSWRYEMKNQSHFWIFHIVFISVASIFGTYFFCWKDVSI